MAPALTQDSHPELLLPYLTTPPYTPSPPSSLVATTSSIITTTTSSTSPLRSSCTNMEVPPFGGHEHQHNSAAPSSHTNTRDPHSDLINLKTVREDLKINFEDPSRTDPRLVTAEPTPPHSTDSSAPLSPLPSEKSQAPLSPLLGEKLRGVVSPLATDATPAATTSNHYNATKRLLRDFTEEEETSFGYKFPVGEGIASPSCASQSPHLGLLSPSSPDKAGPPEVPPSTADPQSFSPELASPEAPTFSIVAPNTCAAVTVAAATAVGAGVASDTPVVATAGSALVDSNVSFSANSSLTKIVFPAPTCSVGVSFSLAESTQTPSMGCRVPLVDTKVGVRCSAPQPNDTPPPAQASLISPAKMAPTPGLFDDGLITTLPDDCYRTIHHLVSSNPQLLEELNCPPNSISSTTSNTSSIIAPAGAAISSNSISNVVGSSVSSLNDSSQLLTSNSVLSEGSVLPLSSDRCNQSPFIAFSGQGVSGPLSVPTVTPVTLPMSPELEASTVLSSLSVRQLRLQKRQAQLLRRVRRLTGRGLASSVSTQLNQLIAHGRPLLMPPHSTNPVVAACSDDDDTEVSAKAVTSPHVDAGISGPLPPPRYDAAAFKTMSTANLISYVREMETRSLETIKSLSVSDTATSQLPSPGAVKAEPDVKNVCLSENLRYELQTVSGEVKVAARLHVEHDSDATESSSGGESCDELDQEYDSDVHTDTKPIATRALYRYEATRAAIAARWSWLEAQLVDVECKIHQHTRSLARLRQLNRYNTSSVLERSPVPLSSANLMTVNRPPYTCGTRTNINGLNSSVNINNPNGIKHDSAADYHGTPTRGNASSINNNNSNNTDTESGNNNDGCARTKGLRWHRKRRWVRVGNIFEHGRGRTRQGRTPVQELVPQPTLPISCRCVAPMQCVMCVTLCNVTPRIPANVYSNTSGGSSNIINTITNNSNASQMNGMQTPLKKALSSASLTPSPSHCLRPITSPLKHTPPKSTNAVGVSSSSSQHSTRSSSSTGGVQLCRNAWYPRVAASCRAGLVLRSQPLHERLAGSDVLHHPLLARDNEIAMSARTESVLRSGQWLGKVAHLITTETSRGTCDEADVSGAQASSLPGYCGLASKSSRHNNHHRRRRHRRHHHGDADHSEQDLYSCHKSGNKKKKKSKDKMKQRSKDREEKRRDKKKKAFKRKEKLEQKARLTLHEAAAGDCSRGSRVGRSNLSYVGDEASSLHGSSRASSPSLPPPSPAEARPLLHSKTFADGRTQSRRPHSPGDLSSGGGVRTHLPSSNRARNLSNKPPNLLLGKSSNLALERSVSVSAEHTSAANRKTSLHSSIAAAVAAAARVGQTSGPLSAPALGGTSATAAASSAPNSAGVAGPPLTPAAAAAVALRNKQSTTPYDIDNIVIPSNMASATPVQPIEYKEIVTPKWREIEEPKPLDQTSGVVLEEDVSDATVVERHARSEVLEGLRFAAHLTTGGTRHGGNARVRQRSALAPAPNSTSSIAGSSTTGTNTPDNPLSPHVDVSDLATPPATPLALSEDSNQSSKSTKHSASVISEDAALATSASGSSAVGSSAKDFASGATAHGDNDGVEHTNAVKSLNDDPALAKIKNAIVGNTGVSVAITVPATIVSTSNSTASTMNDSTATPLAVPGPRKLRSNSCSVRLRSSSNNSSVNNEDEGYAREVSPYSVRKFPLSDNYFASMVKENSEVIPYPSLAVANLPLLHSLDYDDLGEPSSDENDHQEHEQVDETVSIASNVSECQNNKKRKHFSDSCAVSPAGQPETKKRQKKNILAPDISDDSGVGGITVNSKTNIPVLHLRGTNSRKQDNSLLRAGRHSLGTLKKPSALVVYKEHLKKTTDGECVSEGQSSPLSEVTDSAAEDELTGDLLSDSARPPDWTISATADSAGHCVMQVLRH
ncbi:uncharacterized protein LOC108678302 isoform X2 [Hyalella azteca]|uniref:Uncharacterized protein LOC108678302 isoform X2 n=1 Tax=Hyalella azteca TaxID=294128 RepID=A0A8B7P7M6_HYAAZ|nr:uncharacterized protein LOC108678302 isoform X2 [Hyalella azteca]